MRDNDVFRTVVALILVGVLAIMIVVFVLNKGIDFSNFEQPTTTTTTTCNYHDKVPECP